MIDPELKGYLAGLNASLTDIKNKKSPGIWRAFFNGMFGALGYLVGLAIVIIILGWFLNKIGVLPQLQKQVSQFQTFMGSAQKLMDGSANTQQQGTGSQGSYMITLPDGRKAQVVPQQ